MSGDYERQALGRLRVKLDACDVFLSIVTEHYLRDADALLQLGMAVALDKPIYLLVREGTVLPENFRRLARGIETWKTAEDMELAAKRLLERAKGPDAP